MSLRARLLAVLAGLAVAGLVVANVVTYAALRSFLLDRVDRTLTASAHTLLGPLGGRGFASRRDLEGLAELVPGVRIQLRDTSGQVLGATALSGAADEGEPGLPAQLPNGEASFSVADRTGGPGFRVRTQPVGYRGTLVLAAPLDDVAATLRRLALIELVVSLAVVAAIAGAGLWLVRVGLRPLSRIEETAVAIGAGDLSRRVDAEAGPRTEVGRLALALNAMLGQLEAAFAQRTASEQRLRRFVGDASHELRTPLSAVQAYAELFERGARERPADLERAMAGIQRESRRMGTLVDELLLLARLDQGRPLERSPVDLAALAREAVDAARALEPDRPVALDAPERLVVVGDPTRLRQVLDNLLGNVRAHTPPGAPARVILGAHGDRAPAPRATPTPAMTDAPGGHASAPPGAPAPDAHGGWAWVEVADSGPGLAPDQAERAFERFYRADPSRSRDMGGAGLGLAIVAAIASAHGGRATLETAPGAGARFRVELPLASAPGTGARARGEPPLTTTPAAPAAPDSPTAPAAPLAPASAAPPAAPAAGRPKERSSDEERPAAPRRPGDGLS